MKPADDRERALVREALRRPKGPEREAFLDGACVGNQELRGRLEALLRDQDSPDPFLKPQTPPAGSATVLLPPEEGPGALIGRYKILEKLGEGGFGAVYVAEQREPVKRRVALKIIKLGMDTRQVVARFEAERQALALMDHPNIAKVLDAGATETGRPYFVMELVKGIPVTEYCSQEKLGTRARLDLFIQVCRAIQHAHQKGIIHRDIKPSNILVTLHDGVPVPKVIDFGIAKATQQELTEKTVYTQFQQFIGTPAYMSPEQAEMSGLDIDTRSDIYSLGVLLYELLTGSTPFDSKELSSSSLEKMRKIIREREPVRPSTRVRQTASLKVPPSQRSTSDWVLSTDLDWIVMKCLEKDRTRRYETANALAMDIERHFRHEPVVARPPSVSYRLQKSFRRHRLAFVAAGAIASALVLGALVSAWQAVQATRAGRREAAARLQADQAAEVAESQRQRAEREEQRAKASELVARRQAYAADMNLIQQALGLNDLGRARRLLDRHRPKPDEPDLRGWEWRYLWQQCRSDALYRLCQRSNEIYSLAVSHDGNWLAIGEQNYGGLSLWDLRTRQQAARFPSADRPTVAAFSPVEPLLAFSTATNVTPTNTLYGIRLLNAQSNQIAGRELAVSGACRGLAFAGDGRTLLACTADGRLTRWQVSGGERLSSWPVSVYFIQPIPFPLALSRNGQWAAYQTPGNEIRVTDVLTGEDRWTAKPPETPVTALAFSPDGKILVSGPGFADASIRLWDVASGKPLGRLPEGHRAWVSSLVFWPDGKTLASASADQTIRLWDLSDPSHVQLIGQPLRGHTREVWRLALLPNRQTLISGSKDGSVLAWDTVAVRHKRAGITLPPNLNGWGFSTDSNSVITVTSSGQVTRWQGTGFQETQPLVPLGLDRFGVSLSPDGRLLAVGSTNGFIRVWDLEKRSAPRELTAQAMRVMPWGFSAQGRHLLVSQPDDRTLHRWDLATGKEVQPRGVAVLPTVSAVALSSDNARCLQFGWSGESALIELATGRQQALNLNLRQVVSATFSPDGRTVAGASELGLVRIWDTATWHEVATLRGVLLAYHSVAFSPDGRRLATGSNGKEAVKLWDTESYQELLTLEGKGSLFAQTSFSPDGNVLGSASRREMLHLWRAPSLAEIDAADAKAQEEPDLTPQDLGAINQWLVLAPIPFEGQSGATALNEQQIPQEAGVRPRADERIMVGGRELAWRAVRAQDHLLDFNELLEARTEWSVAYAVCYVHSDTAQTGLLMKVGSDDQAKIYLNGKVIYQHAEPRGCVPDEDTVTSVDLRAGLNGLVFKVVNEGVDWQGSVRFADPSGLPLKGVRVTLDPEVVELR